MNRTITGNPLISVIVPVYNAQDYLERCLRSLADQDYPDFEVLLVDDGSTDRSGGICEDWSGKDPRFIACRKENGGVSDARNYGLDSCSGEYIAFVDADDYVDSRGRLYLQFRPVGQEMYADIPTPLLTLEGRKNHAEN